MIFNTDFKTQISTKFQNIYIDNPNAEFSIDNTDNKYTIASAIFHSGHSINSGHYITYVKINSLWYCMNDNYIKQSSWPTTSNNFTLYLLILKKCN